MSRAEQTDEQGLQTEQLYGAHVTTRGPPDKQKFNGLYILV